MYALTANFYPAQEPKNGYIGKADITVAKAIKLNNISVFQKDGGYHIGFAKFGKDNERSYIIPASPEAYAAMVSVVENAIHSEGHFGYAKGELGVKLEVSGAKVNEPYADGRFSVEVGDFCTLNGISTRVVPYEKDGKDASFVAVDIPTATDADGKAKRYSDKEGNERVDYQYECLTSTWTDKNDEKQSVDYGRILTGKVLAKRKALMEPSLDEKIAAGKAQATGEKAADAPAKDEQSR